MRWGRQLAAVVSTTAILTASASVWAVVPVTVTADFENFSEGDAFHFQFTDPLSGIRFYDQVGGSDYFAIDYADTIQTATHVTPGNHLNAIGYAEGPGASVGNFNGFKADLPVGATTASAWFIYANTEAATQVQRNGLNELGQIVASASVDVPRAFFHEQFLSIQSSANDIHTLQLNMPSNDIGTGWDKITYTYTPEPAKAALLIPLAMLAARRRQ